MPSKTNEGCHLSYKLGTVMHSGFWAWNPPKKKTKSGTLGNSSGYPLPLSWFNCNLSLSVLFSVALHCCSWMGRIWMPYFGAGLTLQDRHRNMFMQTQIRIARSSEGDSLKKKKKPKHIRDYREMPEISLLGRWWCSRLCAYLLCSCVYTSDWVGQF